MSQGRLQDEIRQSRPFRSRCQEAGLGLLRTADLLRRSFGCALEGHGITLQQYNVLRILRGAGEEGLPTLAIAERMVEQAPGITRLLDRLEARGWVERHRCAEDRRRVLCLITAAGLDLLQELDPIMDDADDRSLAMLKPEEVERLIQILDRIRLEYS
jgi:DNA-binding MarR family transcriptional regulator